MFFPPTFTDFAMPLRQRRLARPQRADDVLEGQALRDRVRRRRGTLSDERQRAARDSWVALPRALSPAAADEVPAERMTRSQAAKSLRQTIPRLVSPDTERRPTTTKWNRTSTTMSTPST